MGTRGSITFVVDGEREITVYNHFDSYPSHLGVTMAKFVEEMDISRVKEQVRAMQPIDPEARPTPEQKAELAQFTDLGVSSGSSDDWYCLLRGTQGDPRAILDARYFEPCSQFPCDSLFCEWAYVVDLDREVFEVYKGFQKEDHDRGRFAKRPRVNANWAPVALLGSFPCASKGLVEAVTALEDLEKWEEF